MTAFGTTPQVCAFNITPVERRGNPFGHHRGQMDGAEKIEFSMVAQNAQFELRSEDLGEDLLIQEGLPSSYGSGDKRYPLVYMLGDLPALLLKTDFKGQRVYVSPGERELSHSFCGVLGRNYARMVGIFGANPGKNLTVKSRVFSGTNRFTVVLPAVTKALTYLCRPSTPD